MSEPVTVAGPTDDEVHACDPWYLVGYLRMHVDASTLRKAVDAEREFQARQDKLTAERAKAEPCERCANHDPRDRRDHGHYPPGGAR